MDYTFIRCDKCHMLFPKNVQANTTRLSYLNDDGIRIHFDLCPKCLDRVIKYITDADDIPMFVLADNAEE